MWIQIYTNKGTFIIGICYRAPTNNDFFSRLEESIENIKSEIDNCNLIIIGDMNADPRTPNGKKLSALCMENNLETLINEPTRITDTSSSCLDQIISNIPNFIHEVRVDPPISTNDHSTISVKLNLVMQKQRCYYRYIWKFDEANKIAYRQAIENANWDECFHGTDVNQACTAWTNKLLSIAKAHFNYKRVLIRPNDVPWYNNTLRAMKRKVLRVYHKAKTNPNCWETYRNLRNTYQESLADAKTKYEQNLNDELKNSRNSRKWWKTVKEMLGKGKKDSYPPLIINNSFIYDDKHKANNFNKYFLSQNQIDTTNAKLPMYNEYNDHEILDKIEANEAEVLDYIKIIDVNKSTGHDGIGPTLLKMASSCLIPSLTRLINLSLKECTMPDSWKKANVIPIHKKDDRHLVENYRPISILPCVSKIIEKIVFKRVYNYLNDKSALTSQQSGFRPGDSTVNQMAYMYHTFSKALDDRLDVRVVFCDVSKAFDRVWHEGILYKLKNLGISGDLLKWFYSYLQNRQQRVIINGENSEWGVVEAGVPQGSILGPLLFIVYVNDIADNIDCGLKLFADDTTLYITVDNDLESRTREINRNLEQLSNWSSDWLIKFNPTKTKLMNISNKRNRNFDKHPVKLNQIDLSEVQTHKHLGILLSNDLKWNNHIDMIINGIKKYLDVCTRLKYKLDRKTLASIYLTFIRPKLEYGHIIWDNCTKSDEDRLENVQLKFARIVCGAKRGTCHKSLYREIGWPTLKERRKESKLKFMFKIVNGVAPDYLCDLLPPTEDTISNYNLRNGHKFRAAKTRTSQFQKSIFNNCIKLWNDLDQEIKSISDFRTFKKSISTKIPDNPLYSVSIGRKYNIVHSQLRLQCSDLFEHLFMNHVRENSFCHCNNTSVESCYHYFFHCPLYINQRFEMMSKIITLCPNVHITTDLLLYGSEEYDSETNAKIFRIVQTYLKDSERFG